MTEAQAKKLVESFEARILALEGKVSELEAEIEAGRDDGKRLHAKVNKFDDRLGLVEAKKGLR